MPVIHVAVVLVHVRTATHGQADTTQHSHGDAQLQPASQHDRLLQDRETPFARGGPTPPKTRDAALAASPGRMPRIPRPHISSDARNLASDPNDGPRDLHSKATPAKTAALRASLPDTAELLWECPATEMMRALDANAPKLSPARRTSQWGLPVAIIGGTLTAARPSGTPRRLVAKLRGGADDGYNLRSRVRRGSKS